MNREDRAELLAALKSIKIELSDGGYRSSAIRQINALIAKLEARCADELISDIERKLALGEI